MRAMQIRIVEQTDPDETVPNPGWYKVDDFDDKDAAAIRAGTLVRYTVEIIREEQDGQVTVLGDSLNHIGKPGLARLYDHPDSIHYSATEMIRAAKDELTGAAGLEVGGHVVLPNSRPGGAGRLHEVLEIPRDDEGYGLGTVVVRQVDALQGMGKPHTLCLLAVSKEIGPRVPVEGRNRGGINETLRPREGGGWLVYAGELADQVVMSAHMAGLAGGLWVCRSIDEFGPDAWEYGADRDGAIRAHGRKYPNKGVTC